MTKRVIFVDMLNLFYRCYTADPSLSNEGEPVGGVKGSLKSLQRLSKDLKPDEFVLCWDGKGGSKKRKKINENYKEGRKPIRLNRYVHNLTDDQELQNKIWQNTRLIEYLNLFPVVQLQFDQTEADDVIAHLVNQPFYQDWQKIIVSNDKDFFQLCNDSTIVYRPLSRKDKNGTPLPNPLISSKKLVEEHSIHPRNFALARAIAGDKSDNLAGIEGAGLKTIAKRFPTLKDSTRVTIDDIVEFSKTQCEGKKKVLKVYQNVANNRDLITKNYKIMQLYTPTIGMASKKHIDLVLNDIEFEFNKSEVLKMMIADGFGSLSLNHLFAHFNGIVLDQDKR